MSTCVSCGSYYRLTRFHKDSRNCEDCVQPLHDEELELEIQQILHPSGKTASVRYDDLDET